MVQGASRVPSSFAAQNEKRLATLARGSVSMAKANARIGGSAGGKQGELPNSDIVMQGQWEPRHWLLLVVCYRVYCAFI